MCGTDGFIESIDGKMFNDPAIAKFMVSESKAICKMGM
jgi:hypothetical protein